MKPNTPSSTRRFVTRAAVLVVVAISLLVTTSATAQAAQNNQAAYKLAMNRYTQMLKIKKSAVNTAAINAYNSILPCWQSWMQTVVTESNNGTLPSTADPVNALYFVYLGVAEVIGMDSAKPFQNAEDSLVQAQLSRHQLNAVNAARAKRVLALVRKIYATHVCADANALLGAGLTYNKDLNFESTLNSELNKLGTPAYTPEFYIPVGELVKLDALENRVTNLQSKLIKQVTPPIIKKLAALEHSYASQLD